VSIEWYHGRDRRISASAAEALPPVERSSAMLDATDAARIARGLTEKYGRDALSFAEERAQRAIEVGDELALGAWRAVIAATEALLHRMADA
jgi:hypothetical protein